MNLFCHLLLFLISVIPAIAPAKPIPEVKNVTSNDTFLFVSVEETQSLISTTKPKAGKFLVATPGLLHSAFDQTVILLLDFNPKELWEC